MAATLTEAFVKRTRTTLVLPLAGLLVVVGAGAVLASNGAAPATTGTTVVPAAESPSSSASTGGPVTPPKVEQKDTVLTDVLDDLVSKGTITANQKQAILDGIAAERTARQEQRKALREQLKAQRQQLKDFLSDGQITQDELDKLPEDSPLRRLTNLMDDGKITTDELRGLGRAFGFGRDHGFGHFFPKGQAPDTWPAPSRPRPA